MTQVKRIVVKFKPLSNNSALTISHLVEKVQDDLPQGKLVRGPSRTGRAVFSLNPDADVVHFVEELSKRDYIAYAEPDTIDREA